jgi:hypothetical protein
MTIAIHANGSIYFNSTMSIQEARQAIAQDQEIPVWWWTTDGTRYKEEAWFPLDRVDLIRTEHDDG